MKSILFTLFIASIITVSNAQESESLIQVRGQASLSVKPTQVVITYSIRAKRPTYVGAIESLIERIDALSAELKKLNFKKEEIITTNFNVSANRYYDRGEQKEDGFIATQQLMVQFDLDNKRLLDVLNKTASSNADADIQLSFTLDDDSRLKQNDKLLKMAVKNARKKANIMAKESGYEVVGIKEMNYGINGPIPINRPKYAMAEMQSARAADVEFSTMEAADLTLSDQVYIIYKIKKLQ